MDEHCGGVLAWFSSVSDPIEVWRLKNSQDLVFLGLETHTNYPWFSILGEKFEFW
jgi:hypothetical protein